MTHAFLNRWAAAAMASLSVATFAQPTPPTAGPQNAFAVLRDAQGREAGRVLFAQAADGVELRVTANGLAPGAHGFHVHKNGECAPGPDAASGDVVPFGAAGAHFDPMQTQRHGGPDHPPEHVHAGDLPNLAATAEGRVQDTFKTTRISLAPGPRAVLGRSLVVHEKGDDHRSHPAGNSGARVLCGLIEPGVPDAPSPANARHTLPGANAFPEGIAFHAASGTAYVGSSTEGHLYRLDATRQRAEILALGGSPGRQVALGLQLDAHERLWVAGGPTGTVTLVDRRDGRTLRVLKTPPSPAAFVNDIALVGELAYITDSARPVIFRARNVPNDALIALEPWLDLARTPIKYADGINLNGVVASPDGRWLLTVQSNTGQLWRIDTRSKAVTEVALDAPLTHGDGLVLRGDLLHVVRNVEGEIATVELARGWRAGKTIRRVRTPQLRYPTTAAWAGDGLWVVNGQLDKRKDPPPLLPFDVLRIVVPPAP
jgi:superoxide dismutase, Cu-Zn family